MHEETRGSGKSQNKHDKNSFFPHENETSPEQNSDLSLSVSKLVSQDLGFSVSHG